MPENSGRPRLLMVLESAFPTPGGGGAESQVETLSRHMRERGMNVRVIVPMTPYGPQREHELMHDVPVWRIRYPQLRVLGGIVMLGKLAVHLVRERRRYDVIHVHIAHNMAALCAVLGRLLNKTVVVKITGPLELVNGVVEPGSRLNPVKWLRRTAIKRAHFIQAISEHIRRRLIAAGFADARVKRVPNAVDLSRLQAQRATREDVLTGIYTGRLVPQKALNDLLDAWFRAFDPDAPVKLLMVGEGEQRAMLKSRIHAAGRAHQVKLLGGRRRIERFLARADFGVLVSVDEGLSNTLLEYMAAGLPVLGTRISGTVDLVEPDRCGWLVDCHDVPAIAACLAHIGELGTARLHSMGELAASRVRQYASVEAVIERLCQLYAGIDPQAATIRRGLV